MQNKLELSKKLRFGFLKYLKRLAAYCSHFQAADLPSFDDCLTQECRFGGDFAAMRARLPRVPDEACEVVDQVGHADRHLSAPDSERVNAPIAPVCRANTCSTADRTFERRPSAHDVRPFSGRFFGFLRWMSET